MNKNECILTESNINSCVELCNIIDADEESPRNPLEAPRKALICQVIVNALLEIKLSESEETCLSFVTRHTVSCATHSFRLIAFIYGHV